MVSVPIFSRNCERPLIPARRHDGGAGCDGRVQQNGEAGTHRPGGPGGPTPGTGAAFARGGGGEAATPRGQSIRKGGDFYDMSLEPPYVPPGIRYFTLSHGIDCDSV